MSAESNPPPVPPPPPPVAVTKRVIPPKLGEVITASGTENTYTMGPPIGEGHFGVVFSCRDTWENELAAKILKPLGSYELVRAAAEAEVRKLLSLRHPFIIYVYDAFEYQDTLYIVTERCAKSIADLLKMANFDGPACLMPIARCVLQAVHYLHINSYVHQDIHPGNVFAALVKDEMKGANAEAVTFRLGDLGVAALASELNSAPAGWMLPPEGLDPGTFGPSDRRIDIYHVGLLFLQLALSKELAFTEAEILAGKPREMALELPAPYNFALEKALRRHVPYRTATAMELWRDLRTPAPSSTSEAHTAEGETGPNGQTR